jgi:Lrp/AsnC family leucine-responsive transcriptional regulator
MSNLAKAPLDAIDLKILRALQDDARLPIVSLADRVGLSPSPCLRRVKALEAAGVIEGYRAILDRTGIGRGLTVFAGIHVERHSATNADAFVAEVLAMPDVVACHLVSGDIDFLIEIVVPDMATYESSVLRRFLLIEGVREIRSSFAMRSYKATGTLPIG